MALIANRKPNYRISDYRYPNMKKSSPFVISLVPFGAHFRLSLTIIRDRVYQTLKKISPLREAEFGVHLGDFSRIIPGFYSINGFKSGNIEVQDNAVVGSQSILLPGSVVEKDVILGALSVAPVDSVLKRGGVYIGSVTPIMIKNTMHALDERIEEMDTKYKKIVGNLSANLAATTLKVKSRYFHRIGVSGKGVLKIYDDIKGFPNHRIFHPGTSYP
nr:AMP-dependent synthetase/ligase [Tanacetum cinerariifolium]